MQQIKGAVLKTRLAFIEERFGKAAVRQVTDSLPPDDQRALRLLFSSNWYPFDIGRRLDEAIVRVLGGGKSEIFERLGEASAARNLATLHSGYIVKGDPQAFLAKAPAIYSMYYDTGRREYQRTGEHSATITTRDAEAFSAPDCLTVIGWHRKGLEMCGAEKVRVVEEECRARGGTVCRYVMSWA